MQYGYFNDEKREYVITSPKTPLPWINYLGCENFFSLISNTCGGYSFYKDAKLLRLTRYRYNNIPTDSNGRYFFIKEGDTVFNPGYMPTQTPLDDYSCRHGLGYSIFSGTKNSLAATLTSFVPIGDPCEIHLLSLKNESEKPKDIKLFSYVEFCLYNAVDDMTNFQRNLSIGEVEVHNSSIYHKTEYRERRNHYTFFAANEPINGYDTDRETFIGSFNQLSMPDVVSDGQSKNSIASGWSPIGSHSFHLTLQPGESKDFVFILGFVENDKDDKWEAPGQINRKKANILTEKYNTAEKVTNALSRLKQHWDELLGTFTLSSPDEKLNRMLNIWHPYQCMVTFNLSRSASYYESGTGRGMGFRDSCQDILGFVHLIPERARERILDIAATQFPDGSAYHQYQPLTKKGNMDIGSGFNDDPLWLIACTESYLKETGDFSILEEIVPFDNDEKNSASFMEHLHRSFLYTMTHLGPHGLPLIGRADWNDCLNLNCFSEEPGESFQTCSNFESGKAESVFIAAMFVKYGRAYAKICSRIGLDDTADQALQSVSKMEQDVLNHGWDGEWFLRAYNAFEEKVGSRECEEGQIFIEPQGFCVMAGIGNEDGFAQKALDSVSEHLDTEYGIVLLQPAYQTYHKELGEITSYPPGYKENAGIFCHNNPWISIGEAVIGRGNKAFDAYKKICPAYIEDISEIHRTEPYVYSQMIAGKDAIKHGEGKNSWLTGTAAWTYVNASQFILGIQPDYDGLIVDPCIPSSLESFEITRIFRGCTYHITVDNSAHIEKGVKQMTIDGVLTEGNIVPCQADKTESHIIVTMG